jgi:hypothetical protein
MKRIWTLASAAMFAATVLLLPAAATAQASTTVDTAAAKEPVVCFAHPLDKNGARLAQPAGTPSGCYANRAAAVAAYGDVTVLAGAVVGELWTSAYFITPPSSLQIISPNNWNYCADGITWEIGNLSGWNDRTSSTKAYNICTGLLYRDINFGGGAPYVCPTECPTMGSFTNLTSSIRLKRV